MAAAVLFEFHHQDFAYSGKAVLHDLCLSIGRGEKVALVGESGAGKSSLLQLCYQQRRDQIALCPQQPGLVPMLSLYHNIYMGRLQRPGLWRHLRNLLHPYARDRHEIAAIADQLGLGDLLDTSVDQFSGGQQQRAALGRALYRACPTFLGDEPVSAVDELQAHRLLELITRLHETVVVALHDRRLAIDHFDRIIGLRDGRIVLDTPSRGLCSQDLDPVYAGP